MENNVTYKNGPFKIYERPNGEIYLEFTKKDIMIWLADQRSDSFALQMEK